MSNLSIPQLIPTDPPANMPDPFADREDFMVSLATGGNGLRPYHFELMGDDDPMKARMAIVNGMNYLRYAGDLGIVTATSTLVDGRHVTTYGPTEAANAFWVDSVKDGKSPKEILDGWITLRELMNSIKGDAKVEEE